MFICAPGPVRIEFSILTDSVALEGNENFSINATFNETFQQIKLQDNEFVSNPLVVSIQDVNGKQHNMNDQLICDNYHCTVINLEFDQLDYRIKEGTNNNQLPVTVITVSNQNVILAGELQLKITPLTFQQQEALGIPLQPDFPPKPVAASGMYFPLWINYM